MIIYFLNNQEMFSCCCFVPGVVLSRAMAENKVGLSLYSNGEELVIFNKSYQMLNSISFSRGCL